MEEGGHRGKNGEWGERLGREGGRVGNMGEEEGGDETSKTKCAQLGDEMSPCK